MTRRDFLTVANVLETLKVVAPNLKITISDDGRDVTLPIHMTPCDRLVSEKLIAAKVMPQVLWFMTTSGLMPQ